MVHDIVGDVLKAVRQNQPAPEVEALIEKTKERMRDEFRISHKGPAALTSLPETSLLPQKFASRLFEHEYRIQLNPELWKKQWDAVERSLRWFMGSRWLARFQEVGPETWKVVDEVLEFDVDGVKAYVKIDCALDLNGRFILIDWKSSSLRESDAENLLVAALYAHEVWGADPQQIEAYAVSLLDGKQRRADVNEDSLIETHLRIQEQAALLHEEGSLADPFAIPPPSDVALCRRCNFQRLCHPSKEPAPSGRN